MALANIIDYFGFSNGAETILVIDIMDGSVETGMSFFIGQEIFTILGIEHIDGVMNAEWINRLGLRVSRIDDTDLIKNIFGTTIVIDFFNNNVD